MSNKKNISGRQISLGEALSIYERLPSRLKIPSLSPEFVYIDSFRDVRLKPIFWLYTDTLNTFLKSFHCIETIIKIDGEKIIDIESPYGYGGVIYSADNFKPNDFKLNFNKWATDNQVLVEFSRLHPYLSHQENFYDQIIQNRVVVSIDLSKGVGTDYSPRKKTYIRREEKKGLKFFELNKKSHMSEFKSLYYAAMDRLEATGFYYFDDDFFDSIVSCDFARLWALDYSGEIKACILTIENVESGIIEYHLGCSDGDHRFRSMEYLIHCVASELSKSFNFLFLGGGRSMDPDDSLLKFKAGFSNQRDSFSVGVNIFDYYRYSILRRNEKILKYPERAIFYRS